MTQNPLIAIVEDDPDVAKIIEQVLADFGFRTAWCRSAGDLLRRLRTLAPDLCIIDLGLPDMDGIEVMQRVRAQSACGIMILTGRAHVSDRVMGLELGADDYVLKPFEPRELVARIRSVLRRAARSAAAPAPASTEEDFAFDGWRLDPLKRRLTDAEGALVPISSVEFRLLMAFVEHPRQVLHRDRLLDMVQGREAHLFDRAVDNQVSRLRRKVEIDSRNPQMIQTVWGGGYILAADVRRSPSLHA